MPHECHGALAITGSVAIATAVATLGTLPAELVGKVELPADLRFEHPSGRLDVHLERHPDYAEPAAFVVRTARRLFEGYVLVKRSVLAAASEQKANPADTLQPDEEEVV
jgi:2-methylaconitate cis-trans-isomerase PrpF